MWNNIYYLNDKIYIYIIITLQIDIKIYLLLTNDKHITVTCTYHTLDVKNANCPISCIGKRHVSSN